METAVASTSRVTLEDIDDLQQRRVTSSKHEVIVISDSEEEEEEGEGEFVEVEVEGEEEDEDFDSDCFLTPPLPPQMIQSQIADRPLDVQNDLDVDVNANVEPGEEIILHPPAPPSSTTDSLFDPDESSAEQDSPSPSPEPEDEPDPIIKPLVKRRGRGRPPGKHNKVVQETQRIKIEQMEAGTKLGSLKEGTAIEVPIYAEEARATSLPESALMKEVCMDVVEEIIGQDAEKTKTIEELPRPISPKALLPDFIFEPPDESMFAELRAFLDREESENSQESGDDEEVGDEDEEVDEDIYERKRLRKLQANNEILLKLGLAPVTARAASAENEQEEDLHLSSRENNSPMPKRNLRYMKQIKVDSDGTTTNNPPKGLTFELAYVDLPIVRNRIRLQYVYYENIEVLPNGYILNDDNLWIDESDGAEQSTEKAPIKTRKRRQEADLKNDDDSDVLAVSQKKQRRVYSDRVRGPRGEADEGEGTTCHQCRRKTLDPKMRCRYHEQGRVCPLYYCKRCLEIRYGIEFDEDSRTFECPRCSAYCNCSICLHRAGMQRFVPDDINSGLGGRLYDEDGVKRYKSVKHYIEAQVGREFKIGPGGLLNGTGPTLKIDKRDRKISIKKIKEKKVKVKKVREKKVKERKVKERKVREKKVKEKTLRKQRKAKKAAEAEEGSLEDNGRPARKIKVTFKKREEGPAMKKKDKDGESQPKRKKRKVALPASDGESLEDEQAKPSSQAIVSVITPVIKRTRKGAKEPQAATVWVKSKADASASSETESDSESDSELSTLTSLSDLDVEGTIEGMDRLQKGDLQTQDEGETVGEEGDSTGEEDDEMEDHNIQHRSVSPPIGHVEYYSPPTSDQHQHHSSSLLDNRNNTPVSSESDWTSYQTSPNIYMAGYPSHTNKDLANIMSQLRESGLA